MFTQFTSAVTCRCVCRIVQFDGEYQSRFSLAGTGNTMIKAIDVLQQHGVKEENIIVLNLFCTPQGLSGSLSLVHLVKIIKL